MIIRGVKLNKDFAKLSNEELKEYHKLIAPVYSQRFDLVEEDKDTERYISIVSNHLGVILEKRKRVCMKGRMIEENEDRSESDCMVYAKWGISGFNYKI